MFRSAIDVGIWFGAVLRGDNEPIVVGARTNIQEFCMLHTDMGYPLVVGDDCTVRPPSILHGCLIGDGSLVGMGAVVLNGATIGRGCLVGARALVTEGKAFPDHSLIIGSPAKAVRTLDAEAIEGLRRSARRVRGELAPPCVRTETDRRWPLLHAQAARGVFDQIVMSGVNCSGGIIRRNSTAIPLSRMRTT